MFLFASIAQAGKPQPSAQGKWAFAFVAAARRLRWSGKYRGECAGQSEFLVDAGDVGGAGIENYERSATVPARRADGYRCSDGIEREWLLTSSCK